MIKTKFIVCISPQAKQDLTVLSCIVCDSITHQYSSVSNLGIIVDEFLSFDDYNSSVCRFTHFHLRNIGRIRHLLSHHATHQLIHALISIRIDYYSAIEPSEEQYFEVIDNSKPDYPNFN